MSMRVKLDEFSPEFNTVVINKSYFKRGHI